MPLPNPRSLVAALALALPLLAGCDGEQEGAAVRVTVIGDTPQLRDPSTVPPTVPDQVLLASVAQGLVQFDARGQIEPGLAERWHVSNDGLSYIFRLSTGEWPDGSKLTAQQVARILRRAASRASRNPLNDTLGAVEEIVAMTDRVIEIRLSAPRPNLLQLLANPEMAILRNGQGTGPFAFDPEQQKAQQQNKALRLGRELPDPEDEDTTIEQHVLLSAGRAEAAVRAFARGETDLVLGGTFVDLPLARAARPRGNALQFDPVAGLFGLAPARESGPVSEPDVRRLLSQAIDRDALIAALGVPELLPRATILQGGLEGVPAVPAPHWMAVAMAERRTALMAESNRLFGDEKPEIRVALPTGPGADLLFRRLEQDWGVLGLRLLRVEQDKPADLRLVDQVAPSTAPAWFVRRFRCAVAPICSEQADELIDAARAAQAGAQRAALIGEASRLMDDQLLFLPIAAPVRWSLVSPQVPGFAGNRFARHSLINLRQPLERTATE